MQLTTTQIATVIGWVAEGLDSAEINARAKISDNPFNVSRAQVNYYRRKGDINFTEVAKAKKLTAMESGLAVREYRVKQLKRLAGLLGNDLFKLKKLWVESTYETKRGDPITRIDFNAAEVQQYRGILDDIAKEKNERAQRVDNVHTGADGGPIQTVVVYVPDNGRLEA